MRNKSVANCFDEFRDISPKRKDPTIQVLYEYEKHYLEMIKRNSQEIKFIEDMLSNFRKEQETFYIKTLPEIIKKLSEDDGIDDEMQKIWLNRLTTNMERSFSMSENLINNYTIKKIDEFRVEVDEKLKSLQ